MNTATAAQERSFVVLGLSGNPDRAMQLLQGQVTCDLARCTPGFAARGAFCNRNGRVVADAVFLPPLTPEADWRLIVRRELLPPLTELLQPYTRLSRIRLNTEEDICRAFEGDASAPWLQITASGTRAAVNLNPEDTSRSWGLMVGRENDVHAALDAGRSLRSICDNALLGRALKTKAPFLHGKISGTLTPHELNYPDAGLVHFDKGCYLGQEVVARMQHLGKLKKHFHTLKLASDDTWSAGDELVTEKGTAVCLVEALRQKDGWLLGACIADRDISEDGLVLQNGQIAQLL